MTYPTKILYSANIASNNPLLVDMAAAGCEHKPGIDCALTSLPVCCYCADTRPQSSEGYPDYIDGVGMTMTGKRWTKYCSECRDHWETENRREAAIANQPSWAFPARIRPSNLPVRSRPAPPGIRARGAQPTVQTTDTHPHLRPFPPNPFGTREELAAEDWESPLTSMFTRAYTRYRDAENTRRHLERDMQDILDETANPALTSQPTAYTDELRRIQGLARDMASEIIQSQYPTLRQRLSPSPARPNPIDEQPRPPSLSGSEMVVNMACRICNEQRIDTLMEPCLHACMCHWCSEIIRGQAQRSRRRRRAGFGNLEETGGPQEWKCPICRHQVSGARRIYIC